ncbi:MAG: ribonuclease PH [Acidobacteriota bacterium]|nr:MAG: ribonuclease PH [Acidobacteriota bacterium]
MSVRASGRRADEPRAVELQIDVNRHAEGSCLIRVGQTEVLCTASIEERVPPWLVGRGEGWLTAEYGMLPRATGQRSVRDRVGGRPNGRALEIQRLIGRSLRAVVDRKVFGDRTIWVDCDVLQADGGTRCAAITGGFVAMACAFKHLERARKLTGYPLLDVEAAISVGLMAGEILLDLDYEEDAAAEVDVNVVRTGRGRYVEIQGTAEETPLTREQLMAALELADRGTDFLIERQRDVLGERLDRILRTD